MVMLVTGGAGFIGSFVVEQLLDAGHEVRVIDRLHPGAHSGPPDSLDARADYMWGDVADPEVAARAVVGVEALCGSWWPAAWWSTARVGTAATATDPCSRRPARAGISKRGGGSRCVRSAVAR